MMNMAPKLHDWVKHTDTGSVGQVDRPDGNLVGVKLIDGDQVWFELDKVEVVGRSF